MTTLANVPVTCPNCEYQYFREVITSSSAFGGRDLDGRPYGPARHLCWHHVNPCPECGFPLTGEDAEAGKPSVVAQRVEAFRQLVVAEPILRRRLAGWSRNINHGPGVHSVFAERDPRLPARIAGLELRARIELETQRLLLAGQHFLEAAWLADDAYDLELARHFRLHAADAWQQAEDSDEPETGLYAVVRADVLRRAARFERAHQIAAAALEENALRDQERKSLELLLRLIASRDVTARSVDEW